MGAKGDIAELPSLCGGGAKGGGESFEGLHAGYGIHPNCVAAAAFCGVLKRGLLFLLVVPFTVRRCATQDGPSARRLSPIPLRQSKTRDCGASTHACRC